MAAASRPAPARRQAAGDTSAGGDSTAERCGVVDVVVEFRRGVVGVLQQCRNRFVGVGLADERQQVRGGERNSTSEYASARSITASASLADVLRRIGDCLGTASL